MKKCPYCAEEIRDEAIKCRYCGEWIQKRSSPPVTDLSISNSRQDNSNLIDMEDLVIQVEKKQGGRTKFDKKMAFAIASPFLFLLILFSFIHFFPPDYDTVNRDTSINMPTTSLDVLRDRLKGKTENEVRRLVGSPDRIEEFAGKECWIYGNTYSSKDRGIVFDGDKVLTVTFY